MVSTLAADASGCNSGGVFVLMFSYSQLLEYFPQLDRQPAVTG